MLGDKHLYIADVDFIYWANKADLANATQSAAQGLVEQFSIRLENYRAVNEAMIGGALPLIPAGHVPVMYIVEGEEEYDVLFGGVVQVNDGSDASWTGHRILQIATPIKPLKVRPHSIVFYPDEDKEPTDTSRIRRLGQIMEGQLPDWDFTTFVAPNDEGNITYPPPIFPNPNDGTSGDIFTEYTEASVEEILRHIASDPGWPGDVEAYPVQARNWWIEPDFTIPGDPTSGVTWFVHYQNVPVPGMDIIDLLDAPDPLLPDAIIYGAGAKDVSDYSSVVRQIQVTGPLTSRVTGGTLQADTIGWRKRIRMDLGEVVPRVAAHAGALYKRHGVDGAWDSGAISALQMPPDDWEANCQVQEMYLEHETFQVPNSDKLFTTSHGSVWDQPTGVNTIGVKDQMAVPTWGPTQDGGFRGGMHISVVECYGSTVNLRWHLGRNRIGMRGIFRYQDLYNYWYWESTLTGFRIVKKDGGTDTELANYDCDVSDMVEVKISLINSDVLKQIQAFTNNELMVQLDDQDFLWNMSWHGISFNCDADASTQDGAFYDFQCTTFFGDRAFGIGDNREPEHWIDMSFAFIFNSDGTIALGHNGDPIDEVDWEPDMYDTQRSYTYNDRFKLLGVGYMDPVTRSIPRMVQFLKQPGGQGQWLILAIVAPVTVPVWTPANMWVVQFAAKERGAGLANLTVGRALSNLFVAPDTVSPMYGSPYAYPANGALQSDFWNTYVKRERIAAAVFKAEAEAKLTFTCETQDKKIVRGTFARITNRRAGWVLPLIGDDTRKILMCTSVTRIETGKGSRPRFRQSFGSHVYTSNDPGRTHLLKPGTSFTKTLNKDLPTFNGMGLTWPNHVITGREYGQVVEIKITPKDDTLWDNQVLPAVYFGVDEQNVTLPKGMLTPGAKYDLRQRTHGEGGSSDWSETVDFVAPPQPASDRMSNAHFYMGNSIDPILSTGPDSYSEPVQANQGYSIEGWSLSLGLVPGDVELDVEWCTSKDRKELGEAAFVSITASGERPATHSGLNDGTYNEGAETKRWHDQAANVQTGDWLRLRVLSADTEATKATAVLKLKPLEIPFTQLNNEHQGVIVPQPPVTDDDGEELIEDDDAPIIY